MKNKEPVSKFYRADRWRNPLSAQAEKNYFLIRLDYSSMESIGIAYLWG